MKEEIEKCVLNTGMKQKLREELSEVETSNLPYKELKVMIIIIFKQLRRMDEQ